ncbi:MAG: cytochrome c oxidase assembly protein [Gammaproteobacteria bacterium]|nr:cytochrome c oxidase assembly protein [Gammaproteobacteria bacterium]
MNSATVSGPARHRPLVLKLTALVAASFVFGFALVPFYDTLCRAVGFNGRTLKDALAAKDVGPVRVDLARQLTVQFSATLMPGLPWEIRPLEPTLDIHPGEIRTTRFLVRNTAHETITGQAVPSVSPSQAALSLRKLDCFCFRQQTLGPGESRELALTFIVNPDIDIKLREMTLAYAFFPAPTPSSPTGDQP